MELRNDSQYFASSGRNLLCETSHKNRQVGEKSVERVVVVASSAPAHQRSYRDLTGKIPLLERFVGRHALPTTSILARWRHYPRLKICVELQVCRPQGSASLPPPRQYAGRCRQCRTMSAGKSLKFGILIATLNVIINNLEVAPDTNLGIKKWHI